MAKAMRKVLVVAWFFPPMGGGGVQRTLKFIKYLPSHGWQPVVLAGNPQKPQANDTSFLAEIPEITEIQRCSAWLVPARLPFRLRNLISRWLLVVDEQVGWMPFAVRTGRKIIQAENPQVIYTTSAPCSDHLIGLQLQAATGLPWIVDFRDPWIGNFSTTYPTPIHKNINAHLEKKVVENASQILVVSEPMRASLLQRYPTLLAEKVITISNGYDADDFLSSADPAPKNDALTITYTGTFYQRDLTAHAFLAGLIIALESGRVPHDKIRVQLVGNIGKETKKQISSLGLTEIVSVSGYVEHRSSIEYLMKSDMLLLVIGTNPGVNPL